MVWLRVLVALPFGLALGSFMTVATHRLPEKQSVVRPRSRCPNCGAEIRNRDNVPVVSWLVLRGRCRDCGARISFAYPLLELATAALVVAAAVRYERPWVGAMVALMLALMPAIAFIDLRHRIVPNRIVVPAAAVTLVAHTAIDPSVAWLAGALGASGFLFVAVLAYPKGLGMGDVKLALLLGAMLGGAVVVALLLGFVAALVPSVALFARHGSGARKMAIPLVPFLSLGAVVALFFGQGLLHAYLGLF